MIIDSLFQKFFSVKPSGKKSGFVSFAKSISWRVVGTMDTILISYWITGKVKYALSIGSVELFTKIILYYLHERAWETLVAYFNASSQTESSAEPPSHEQ